MEGITNVERKIHCFILETTTRMFIAEMTSFHNLSAALQPLVLYLSSLPLVLGQVVPVDKAAALNQDLCRRLSNKCHAIHPGFAEMDGDPETKQNLHQHPSARLKSNVIICAVSQQ